MTGYSAPEACNWSKDDVHHVAEELAQLMCFGPGDPIEPKVEELGGRIEYLGPGENSEDGSLIVEGPRSFVITLPQATSATRDRFTIAHELGHYILHSSFGEKPIKASRFGKPSMERIEWEANWFAAAFLMPADHFRETWARLSGDAACVADRYRVSPQAASVRARVLGLVDG